MQEREAKGGGECFKNFKEEKAMKKGKNLLSVRGGGRVKRGFPEDEQAKEPTKQNKQNKQTKVLQKRKKNWEPSLRRKQAPQFSSI